MKKSKFSVILITLLLVISPVLAKEPSFLENFGPGTPDNPREDNPLIAIIVGGIIVIIGILMYMIHHTDKFRFLKPFADYLEKQDKSDKTSKN